MPPPSFARAMGAWAKVAFPGLPERSSQLLYSTERLSEGFFRSDRKSSGLGIDGFELLWLSSESPASLARASKSPTGPSVRLGPETRQRRSWDGPRCAFGGPRSGEHTS